MALVEFASSMGFDCTFAGDEVVKAKLPDFNNQDLSMDVEDALAEGGGEEQDYEVIRRMDFNSDRKRMSILVRDPNDKKLKLYIKGADSIIIERLKDKNLNSEIQKFLKVASTQGLRTLLMGMRLIDQAEADEFLKKCQEAEADLTNKEKRLDKVYSDFE